jgi:3-phosphoshikimate 1-carboxyvinyltransferase
MSTQLIRPARSLQGSLTVPGDKSISHRYAMLAGLAEGTSRLANFSTGADPHSSLACMEALGAKVLRNPDGTIEITGVAGSFRQPAAPLDCGNSGSTMRMLSGLIASHPHTFTLVGDPSLTLRPMDRIRNPLSLMGAKVNLTDGHAPIIIHGTPLTSIDFTTPIPSAQVKTAILFAGLQAEGVTGITESILTRDHTEHALLAFGATLTRTYARVNQPARLSISGGQKLKAIDSTVPGDISSAAFFLCAALLFPDSNLILDSLGMNPTRAALLDVIAALGGKIRILTVDERHGELIGTIQVNSAPVAPSATPFIISGPLTAQLIDELPVLAAIAPFTIHWHHPPRRPGTPRQGVRPHRSGRQESPRHGRAIHREPRWPRNPRQSNPPRRIHRLRLRPPHCHGLRHRRSARHRRQRNPRRRSRRHLLPGVLHLARRPCPAMKQLLSLSTCQVVDLRQPGL